MGKFRVEVTKIANQDIEKHKKSGNKRSIDSIAKILVDLSENPYIGFGNPEPLKHGYSGFWSRRINQKRQNDLSGRRRYCNRFCSFSNGALL